MFRDVGARPAVDLASTIPCSIYAVFELSFALLTPTIVAADIIGNLRMLQENNLCLNIYSFSDRVNVFGLVFFILAWHLAVYCPVAHITWHPRGYLYTHSVEDFGGGVVVNMLASATIVASNVFLDLIKAPNYSVKIPNDAQDSLRSALLLWLLWVGLLAGKAHDASPVAAQAVVNSIAAVQVAVLLGYLQDRLYSRQLADAPISMLSNILLGLAAVTPVCGDTSVGGAMFVSVVTVLVSKLAGRHVLGDGVAVNDPLNITTIHGIGGTVGFIMTAVSSYSFINPAALDGLTAGHQKPIRMHVAAALALWVCIFVATLVLHFLCNFIVPISSTVATDRVFLPVLTHDIPLRPDSSDLKEASTFLAEEHDRTELAREISLYRKLSRYFSQGSSVAL